MSVWNDAWGYLSSASRAQSVTDTVSTDTYAGPARDSHITPGPATTTRDPEEVAGMTPAYLGTTDRQADDPVTPPGWPT